MAFRVLALFSGVMLTLGIGPSTVLGQGPVVPDPRVRDERTTDGIRPTGNKYDLRDVKDLWGPNAIGDCWARMLAIELGLGDVVFGAAEEEKEEKEARDKEAREREAREREEREREERERREGKLADDDEYRRKQETAWKEDNERMKSWGYPQTSREDFEKGLKMRLEERRKARAAASPLPEPPRSQPQPSGSESERPDSCLTQTAQSEIEVDVFLRTRSAIRKQADALQNSNDPNLKKVGGDLERLAEKVQPPEAGTPPPPDPLSFWIHGRPPGGAGNPGPGLVFDVASVATFRDAGVTLLSNTWSSPRAWPGSVYAERDQPRTVAPAPGLDPASWPTTHVPVLSLSLEEPAP